MSENKQIKLAVPDSVQKELRQNKAQWNAICSKFISKLIAFKRGMNGKGDPRFGLPASKIQFPLPDQIPSYLSSITTEFEMLAEKAAHLIDEQKRYSETRHKSQNGVLVPPKHASYELIVEASNPLSRFFTYVKTPFSKKDGKQTRTSMLLLAHEIYKELLKLEDLTLSSSDDSIEKLYSLFMVIRDKVRSLETMSRSFNVAVQKNDPGPALNESGKFNPEFKKILLDGMKKEIDYSASFIAPSLMMELQALYNKLKESSDDEINVHDKFEEALQRALKIAMRNTGLVARNFKELFHANERRDAKKNKSDNSDANDQFIIEAGNFLTRWLGKKKHKIFPYKKTSGLRLSLHNKIIEAKKIINDFMDDLERFDNGGKDINEKVLRITAAIIGMQDDVSSLEKIDREDLLSKMNVKKLKEKRDTKRLFNERFY